MNRPIRPRSPGASSAEQASTAAATLPASAEAHAGQAGARPQARRTQEERSTDTQRRLCEAALALLTEVGYERLTTAQIAQRAGVSKGAQAHHYPTKDDMLVAAFRHLLGQWRQRRERYIAQHGQGSGMEDLLQGMWRQVFGRPDYLASLEVMLAARHHPLLGERLREILAEWSVSRDEAFRRMVPLEDPQDVATFMQLNFSVLRGLAVFEGVNGDSDLPRRMLDMWAEIATAFVASRSQARISQPDRQPQLYQ